MVLYSGLFGDYPFKNEKYGHVQFGWGGGMEHQTCSFMVNVQENLVTHELAHQWFGDKVTCAAWEDIWLNEGFATHLASIYSENKYPGLARSNRINEINNITSVADGSVWVDNINDVNRIFNQRLSYNKGSHLLYMLRWILGDATFFTAIQNYVSDPALTYGFATTAQLKSHLETASGKNLTYFFNQWFTGQGYPSYQIEWYPSGNTVQVKIGQTQSHPSVSFFRLPVPLLFRNVAAGKEKLVVLDHTSNGQTFFENIGFEATEVIFDPDVWLITRNNTLTQTSGPLPVIFTTFEGKCENGLPGSFSDGGVSLRWQTAEEINAGHFVIQRSVDGRHFEAIGQVAATGESKGLQEYRFRDHDIRLNSLEIAYYRLEEVDKDGKRQYSRIISVDLNALNARGIRVSPNPSSGMDAVVEISAGTGKCKVVLTDVSGHVLQDKTLILDAHPKTFSFGKLKAGTYVVTAILQGKRLSRRFVVQW